MPRTEDGKYTIKCEVCKRPMGAVSVNMQRVTCAVCVAAEQGQILDASVVDSLYDMGQNNTDVPVFAINNTNGEIVTNTDTARQKIRTLGVEVFKKIVNASSVVSKQASKLSRRKSVFSDEDIPKE